MHGFVLLFYLLGWFFEYNDGSLQQLSRYLSSINCSSCTSNSQCVHDFYTHREKQGNPPRYCRHKSLVELNKFNLQSETDVVQQCMYQVSNNRRSNSINKWEAIFIINIDTMDCTTFPISSGSSFTVSVRSNSTQQIPLFIWCNDKDTNNGQYNLHCRIPLHLFPNASLALPCLFVDITLDYEAYHAYHEVHSLLTRPLYAPLNNSVHVCFDPPPEDAIETIKALETKSAVTFGQSVSISDHIATCLSPTVTGNRNSSTSERSILLRSGNIVMIGSSHMRYIWDSLVVDHIPDGRAHMGTLPVHHGDASAGSVRFVSSLFAMQLPQLLRDICDDVHDSIATYHKEQKQLSVEQRASLHRLPSLRVTLVVQTLAWDLDYMPPGDVLRHDQSSKQVIAAIKHMAGSECGRFIDIVWLTAMPLPVCQYTTKSSSPSKAKVDPACTGGGRGYRNNHAIQALNEYFVNELSAIRYPTEKSKRRSSVSSSAAVASSSLRILDAFGLVYPHHGHRVCGLHFTCTQRIPLSTKNRREERGNKNNKSNITNNKNVTILQTPGGKAVVDAVIGIICGI